MSQPYSNSKTRYHRLQGQGMLLDLLGWCGQQLRKQKIWGCDVCKNATKASYHPASLLVFN